MDKLVPTLIKLQDVFKTIGSEFKKLPELVVIGSQSSGKSSVLENIVGIDFLPRGAGIVTRRPLVLQLVNIQSSLDKNQENGVNPYAEFLHLPDKKFYDFSKVRTEIEEETARLSGNNKGISTEAIHLKIFSPYVCDLTLVDLPGLVKIPTGDQPENIGEEIESLVFEYISNKNAIILAVIPANIDLETSEALMLAKRVDRLGERTFTILTKLDLMDQGTNAKSVLEGEVIDIKLGIVGVVNRSQLDIKNGKNIKVALKDEKIFLEKYYPSIASKNGTEFLSKALNGVLMNHIKICFPDLKKQINEMLAENLEIVKPYDQSNHFALITSIISSFTDKFKMIFLGHSPNVLTNKLHGGARINYLLNDGFNESLNKICASKGLTDTQIITAIRNKQGIENDFSDLEVFKPLVKSRIELLKQPSLALLSNVFDESLKIIKDCCENFSHAMDLKRFPKLSDRIYGIIKSLFNERLSLTKEMIVDQIQMELCHIQVKNVRSMNLHVKQYLINSRNDDAKKSVQPTSTKNLENKGAENNFLGMNLLYYLTPSSWAKENPPDSKNSESNSSSKENLKKDLKCNQEIFSASPKERETVRIIQCMLEDYYTDVKKIIIRSIPKVILYKMIDHVLKNVQEELIRSLMDPELLENLLSESKAFSLKKKEAEKMIKALEKALSFIDEVQIGT